jgi:cell division protein FtsL
MRFDEYARHRRSRNRVLHSEKGRRQGREFFLFLVAAALLVTPCLVYVGLRHQRMRLEREIQDMQSEIRDLREENHRLGVRRGELESLHRVEEVARHELGLAEVAPEHLTLVFTDETGEASLQQARREIAGPPAPAMEENPGLP